MKFYDLYGYLYYRVYSWEKKATPKSEGWFTLAVMLSLLTPAFVIIISIFDIGFGLKLNKVIFTYLHKHHDYAIIPIMFLGYLLNYLIEKFEIRQLLELKFALETEKQTKKHICYLYIFIVFNWLVIFLILPNEVYLHSLISHYNHDKSGDVQHSGKAQSY